MLNFVISVIKHMKPERKPPCTAVVCSCHSTCILVMGVLCMCVALTCVCFSRRVSENSNAL